MTRAQILPALLLLASALSVSAFVGSTPRRAAFVPVSQQVRPVSSLHMAPVGTESKQEQSTLGIVNYNKASTEVAVKDDCEVPEEPEEQTETEKLLAKVKEAGTAGVISYALWELAFWFISIPVCIIGYHQVTGHWPDLSNSDDQAKVGAEAFAFVNFARFAVPLRIGLALSTTSWIQENIVDRYLNKDEEVCEPVMNEESDFGGDQK
ncbi:Protein of unknown function (DUF2499) [Seminavis robusta]|uniref:Uncharacterized protein n=1 Tax=Seminavis robusta TaxID=568900 RepID=A0A9N8EA43_9STRA|nr:Protein of unknown function (DUF2499) [Seminavis robusta]|eukprot:Sro716_g191900.1 Protein of unknown function (DUF2499) (208) ;mRNA; r:28573-29298